MESNHWNPSIDLVDQRAFLERLARNLVRDQASADDLVQDTLTRALNSKVGPTGSVRAWLVGVLRNAAKDCTRSASRRSQREQIYARPEAVLDRSKSDFEASESMVHAMRRLDEVTRSILILRYQDDLSIDRIAKLQRMSLATVKSRIHRGLAKLREELGANSETRSLPACVVLLARRPHQPPVGGIRKTLALPISMSIPLKASLAVVSTAALALAVRWASSPDAQEAGTSPVELASHSAGNDPVTAVVLSDSTQAVRVQEPQTTPTPSTSPAPEPAMGVVVDLQGQPLADIPITLDGDPYSVMSAASGRFVRAPGSTDGRYGTDHESLATVAWGVEKATGGHSHAVTFAFDGESIGTPKSDTPSEVLPTVVVAPTVEFRGRVTTESGEPVPGALVFLVIPESWSAALSSGKASSAKVSVRTTADSKGAFALEHAPRVAGSKLFVKVPDDRRYAESAAPAESHLDLTLTVADLEPSQDASVVRGVVYEATGAPAAGAWLSLGSASTESKADGTFLLDATDVPPGTPLKAIRKGLQPVTLEDPAAPSAAQHAWPAAVEVILGAPTLELRGVVVGPDGLPVPDVSVEVMDSTPFGRSPRGIPSWVEDLTPPLNRLEFLTDDEGRFRLGGLVDRPYQIEAYDHYGHRSVVVKDQRPQLEPIEIRLGAVVPLEPWSGQCMAPDGTPLPGLSIAAIHRKKLQGIFPGTAPNVTTGRATTTDAEGRFLLKEVPATVKTLTVHGAVTTLRWDIAENADRKSLEVVLDRACPFRVELGVRWSECDNIALENADKEPMPIKVGGHEARKTRSSAAITDGRTGRLEGGESTRFLVLRYGETVLHRQAVRLKPQADAQILRLD